MAIKFLSSGNISGSLEVNKSANAAVEIAKFKVTGTGGSFGAFSFVSILPGSGNFATQLRLHTNNTGNAFQSINNNAGVLELATNDNNPLVLKTNSTTRLTISNVGAATFTGSVSGITPTAAANFVTKAYADGLAPGAGVFLPLAGGTLTGATATATGISFTVGGYFQVNSTTTLGGAVTIEGNLFMDGYNITSIDELSASTGTFAGNVNISSAGDLYINSGTSYNNKGSIFMSNQRTEIVSDIVDGTANGDTSLNFKTRSGGATASALFIDEFRRIGIGTDSPDGKLDVSGAAVSQYITSTSGSQATLFIGRSVDTQAKITSGDVSANDLCFYVNNTRRLVIQNGGNVGIGTDSPGSKLTVSGTSTAASNTPSQAIVDIVGTSTAHLLMGTASVSPYGAWINTDSTTQPLILMGTGGNVGIGTTSPDEILHVYNASAGDASVKIESTSGGDPTIYLTSQTANRQGIISFQDNGINAGRIIYEHATDIMTFYTGGTGAAHLELTLEETTGAIFRTKIGIGLTTPSGNLSMNSQIYLGTNPPSTYTTNTTATRYQSFFNSGYGVTSDGLGPYPRYFDMVATGSPDGFNGGSNIRFFTTGIIAATGAEERMTITSAGDVEIKNGSFSIENGTGTSEARTQTQVTNSVGTSATTILTAISDGMSSAAVSKVTVYGNNNSTAGFYDEVLVCANAARAPQVITALETSTNTAHTRTYTNSGNVLQLAMGATGYNVNVKSEAMGYPW